MAGTYEHLVVGASIVSLGNTEYFSRACWTAMKPAVTSSFVGPHNPVLLIPTVVLDDGEALVVSWGILDEINRMVGQSRAPWCRTRGSLEEA